MIANRKRWLAPLGILMIAAWAISCSSTTQLRARPASRMFDRSMAQLGMVRLVVRDPVRAERVQRLYERIESIYLEGEAARRHALSGAFSSSKSGEPEPEQVFHAVSEATQVSAATFQEYVAVQMELRKLLTRDEFAKLGQVR